MHHFCETKGYDFDTLVVKAYAPTQAKSWYPQGVLTTTTPPAQIDILIR